MITHSYLRLSKTLRIRAHFHFRESLLLVIVKTPISNINRLQLQELKKIKHILVGVYTS